MKSFKLCLVVGASLAAGAAAAAERAIAVPPAVQMSWEFVTPGNTARLRPQLGVGFWQRASGAKPGVGANYVTALEYQLPEAAPARVRSATFQFSGRPSQCVGTEPVVIDVHAYAADGRADVSDAHAGSRIAQLSADCNDRNAFARPIDVTALVRQMSVASGVRYLGFNIRKANHRQGPGLFALAAGRLTVVLADAPTAPSMVRAPAAAPPGKPMTGGSVDAKFRGDWVPAHAACGSPLKLVIEANAVTFVNGAQRVDYRRLEQCFSCAGGARAIDPPTMLSTDAMGDSPWMIYLDHKKKTPSLTVDFSNDRKLGARFPLGTAALKKCS